MIFRTTRFTYLFISLFSASLFCLSVPESTPFSASPSASLRFYDTLQQTARQLLLDHAMADTFSFEQCLVEEGAPVFYAVKIGSFLDKSQRHALVMYSNSREKFSLEFYRFRKNKFEKIFADDSLGNWGSAGDSCTQAYLQIDDYNGDGINDLRVRRMRFQKPLAEFYHLWIYGDTHNLESVPAYEEISNPVHDPLTNRVFSHKGGGCLQTDGAYQVFEWQNNDLLEEMEIYIDACRKQKDKTWVRISSNQSDGNPQKTERWEKNPLIYLPKIMGGHGLYEEFMGR
jgi:hypothetical protein